MKIILFILTLLPLITFSQIPDGVYKHATVTVLGGIVSAVDSTQEVDPTVDIDVKNITNSDLNRWNDAATLINTGYPNYTLLDYLINHVWIPQSTDALAEGTTNLYYSISKFNAALNSKTTDNLSEGLTHKYFSNSLARSAISVSGSSLGYNSGTGVISIITANTSQAGIISSTDWNTFNNKQSALGFTPIPNTRSITINGSTQDLTIDRNWTITASPPLSAPTANIAITSGTAFQPRSGGPCNILVNTNVSGLVGVGSTVVIAMSPTSGGTYTTVANDAVSITVLTLGDKASGLIPVPTGYWVKVTYTAVGLATVSGTYTKWDL